MRSDLDRLKHEVEKLEARNLLCVYNPKQIDWNLSFESHFHSPLAMKFTAGMHFDDRLFGGRSLLGTSAFVRWPLYFFSGSSGAFPHLAARFFLG